MAKGMDFAVAYRKFHIPRYHEHRCECPCGCKHDTLGYALCPSCSYDAACGAKRLEKADNEERTCL